MYPPKNLNKWERAKDYGGEDLSEWYTLIAQTRDSYLLERNNFAEVKKHIESKKFEIVGDVEDCKQDNAFLLASFGHWACGWIESIMVHESNELGLMLADEIKAQLEDYPIFNDDSYYTAENDLQWEYVSEYVVRDYLRDNDIEYDETLLNKITSKLFDTCQFETNGYDEVITSDDYDLESIVEYFRHVTICPNCHDEIDNRTESCSCQLSLPLDTESK